MEFPVARVMLGVATDLEDFSDAMDTTWRERVQKQSVFEGKLADTTSVSTVVLDSTTWGTYVWTSSGELGPILRVLSLEPSRGVTSSDRLLVQHKSVSHPMPITLPKIVGVVTHLFKSVTAPNIT